jgi:hypothetical protein
MRARDPRQLSLVATSSAGLAVIATVGAGVIGVGASTSFAVGSSVVGVVALLVGLLGGYGLAVAGGFGLSGIGVVAAVVAGDVGLVRVAVAACLLYAATELARLSLDARQPCRFDRRVLEDVARRILLTAGALAAGAAIAAFLDDTAPARVLVPLGLLAVAGVVWSVSLAGRVALAPRVRPLVALGAAVLLVGLVGAAALSVAGTEAGETGDDVEEVQPVPDPAGDETDTEPVVQETDFRTVVILRLVVFALLALLALFLGGVLIGRAELTLDPYELDPEDDVGLVSGSVADLREVADDVGADEAIGALDDALADLERIREPGLAVRLAYSRAQTGFGRDDIARRPVETEGEYLARLLSRLGVSAEAMRRLTDLFEQARFSRHQIDEDMRRAAVDAFTAVRDELTSVRSDR